MCSAEVFKDENPQLASHFCRSMFTGRLSQQKKPYNHSKGISKVCPTNQTVNAYQLQTKFGKTIPWSGQPVANCNQGKGKSGTPKWRKRKVSNGKGYKSSSIHYINLTNVSVQIVFPMLII